MMGMCKHCSKFCGWLWLIFGVIFLLQNLGTWDFWGIQWYTVLFVLMGMSCIGKSKCKDCE